MRKYLKDSISGFTLVEMALVLVILGLLIGMGAGMVGMLTKRAKMNENRETVKTAYEAIRGYATANKRLPSSLSGLGIKTDDPYGKSLVYNPAGGITVSDLCTTKGNYITVNDKGTSKTNVAFIVFSPGENICNETGTSSPFNIYEVGTKGHCSQNPDLGYDDIVRYLDINTLRQNVCNPFKITTEFLNYGTVNQSYPNANLSATDGTTPYTWSLKSGSSLPPGLSLSKGGVISGIPKQAGTFSFTLEVRDSDSPQRVATKTLSIAINYATSQSSGGTGGDVKKKKKKKKK